MTASQALTVLGQIDGGIAAAALAAAHLWPSPQAASIGLAVAGIAGGLGIVLQGVAKLLGVPPPPVPPAPPQGA